MFSALRMQQHGLPVGSAPQSGWFAQCSLPVNPSAAHWGQAAYCANAGVPPRVLSTGVVHAAAVTTPSRLIMRLREIWSWVSALKSLNTFPPSP